MPGKDQLTGQKAQFGNRRSHALNATRRRFDLNLRYVTLEQNGQKVRLRVTAKTARTLRKKGLI
ncbi:50S ribosomal protein L28 [Mycoplasmopsis agassizii]|uniref:Large ribosomal subunit protein bL28 n=1 Tax=Mycoplasmopsis agassizii TaxID=33922 RepID=A0A1W1X3C3_9BACT|nr:50S ribosomal protein L28 [Mycoplasmopsis agassizii]PAF55443.1 50S ribosomal protein L28 [Mycoplasmopsis agassizii]PAK21619.1 50S ribosomal protein L28 [Mycoplasmopsis agassizii]SMC18444.1 large subunit ribosomal protein L28 [Mycoplasmopsis agassizii]